MKCSDCKFFETGGDHGSPHIVGSGHCARWHEGYSRPTKLSSNLAWVEFDEGWGNIVGPDFGCVLFEATP